MKHLIKILAFSLLSLNALSQNHINYYYLRYDFFETEYRTKLTENNITEVTKTSIDDDKIVSVKNYNKEGLLIKEVNFYKKRFYQTINLYNQNQLTRIWVSKKGKAYSNRVYRFNTKSTSRKKQIESIEYSRKGKRQSLTNYKWLDSNKISKINYYKKDKLIREIVYVYENGQKTEIKHFEKGELKYIETFNCDPLGKRTDKVTETKNCINTEFDSKGNKIKTFTELDKKGLIYKRKLTYLGKSDSVIKIESFNSNNILTYLYSIDDSTTTTAHYSGKGKEKYKYIEVEGTSSNGNKTLITTTYNKGKFDSKSETTFNKQGLPSKITTTTTKYTSNYAYSYK